MFTQITSELLEQLSLVLAHELQLGVMYPFAISFVCMLALTFFKFAKNLRWLGGLLGGLFAIISMLRFINFTDPRAYSMYVNTHDKMIYMIILACALSLLISILSLAITQRSALKSISIFFAIIFVGVCVYWFEIIKIEKIQFEYIPLIIVPIVSMICFILLINDGFHRDISSGIVLTVFCILYGLVFGKSGMPDYSNTCFALAGVSLSYIFMNYLVFSSRLSLALGFMMGGMLVAILNSVILFNGTIDSELLYSPLILLLVSPVCRFLLNLLISHTNKIYKYILPILTLIVSVAIAGLISGTLIFIMPVS